MDLKFALKNNEMQFVSSIITTLNTLILIGCSILDSSNLELELDPIPIRQPTSNIQASEAPTPKRGC